MNRVASVLVPLALFGPSILAAQGHGPSAAVTAKKATPPYLIVARVLDVNGTPVEGAGLAVGRGKAKFLDVGATRVDPYAKTDAQGRLSALVERVEGESVTLLLSAKGKVCLQLMPRTMATTVDGRSVAKADFGTVILGEGVDVRGLVRSKDGQPIAGVRVVATGVLAGMMNDASRLGLTTVRAHTQAVTDQKGIVRLLGIPRHGVSVQLTAKGFYPRRVGYINRHTPLVVTMARGGEILGRILDSVGKPVNGAGVRLYSEDQSFTTTKTVGADGVFRMDVPGPGRYRIYYYARLDGAARHVYLWSKVLRGPQPGIDLSFDGPAGAEQPNRAAHTGKGPAAKAATSGLVVKITDKKTGSAVRKVRATAAWYAPNMWQHNPGYLERLVRSATELQTDEQGKVTLPKPAQGQPSTGRLMVVAEGYAAAIVKDLEWDEDAKSNEVAVQLELESVLAGVVHDATGKPVSGATIFVTADPMVLRNYVPPPMRRMIDAQFNQITTDEKGEFRFGGLGAGKQHVYFAHPKHAEAEPVVVDLGAHESKTGLAMVLPKGATIFGKLVGATPKLGWRVRIRRLRAERQNFRSYRSLTPDQASEFAAVRDDGAFAIEGLSRGNYNLSLLMPGGEDRIELPIEPLRVRSKDVRREFDISEDMPGRIEGAVVIKGASLPPGRLLLLAAKLGHAPRSYYTGRPNLIGHPTVVGAGGKFSLAVPEGNYHLQLVDLQTAVTLYQGVSAVTVKPTMTVTADLSIDLAAVTVKLVSEKEGQAVGINRIEIRVSHPPRPGDPRANRTFGGSDRYQGVGLEIKPGTTSVDLILPCVETKLLVRSDAHNLDPKQNSYNFPAQGEVELHPKTAKSNRIEIRVAEPEIDVANSSR